VGTFRPLLIDGIRAPALRYEIVEGETCQWAEVAVFLESSQTLLLQFFLYATARYYLAEIGRSVSEGGMDKTLTMAQGASR